MCICFRNLSNATDDAALVRVVRFDKAPLEIRNLSFQTTFQGINAAYSRREALIRAQANFRGQHCVRAELNSDRIKKLYHSFVIGNNFVDCFADYRISGTPDQ